MKKHLIPTLLLGLVATIAAPRVDAGIDIDFRLELGWRAEYYHDFDAAVVLYEYSGYRGRRLVLYPGENLEDFYDYEWGFRVRSVEIIGPVHIVLFDESGLWGHQLSIYNSTADLGDFQMRLNNYSTFRWHRRARSAFASFNAPNVDVSVYIGSRIFPRLYCATRVIPQYYDPWPSHRYHRPRPQWHYDRYRRHVPVPPPNPRVYRPDRSGPGVSPPPRHTTAPVTPPPDRGRPPSIRPPTNPPTRPGSIGHPTTSRPSSDRSHSIGRPNSRPPNAPPSRTSSQTAPQNKPQNSPPSRTPPSQTQSSRDKPNISPVKQPSSYRTTKPAAAKTPTTKPPQRVIHRTTKPTRSPSRTTTRTAPPPRKSPPRASPPPRSSTPPRSSPPPPPNKRKG